MGIAHWSVALLLAWIVSSEAAKPNVILVMADDLGWGDVGFNGNKIIQTPHLDAMAANGLTFSRFYAAAPVCSPTRGSCLTGRHPFRYGIPFANTGHMKPQEETLAEILKGQGYATGHFGKWHLGTLTKTVKEANRGGSRGIAHFAPPQDHGFDICFSTESKVPTHAPLRKPDVFAKGASLKNGWDGLNPDDAWNPYGTHYWNERGEMVKDTMLEDDSKEIMDRALPFIENSVGSKKPFLAVIWFHAPHLPVAASERHRAPYQKYSVHERNYFGCITALDEQVGRLRGALRDLGAADDTMLWFCSDNGPEGGAKSPGSAGEFRGRKRALYEGGVRVPGLLEWPAVIKEPRTTAFAAVTSD
jgi:arylsulfatase A-like enzyme